MVNRATCVLLSVGALLASTACAGTDGGPGTGTGGAAARTGAAPALRVQEVAGGFENAWDLGFLPDGKILLTERGGKLSLLSGSAPGARVTTLRADLGDVYAQSEGGLMGIVVHPDFASSREFTTCQTHQENGEPTDIRLVTWKLGADERSAQRVRDPLLGGLPISTGRHSGCQPTIGPHGELLVGTGDTARAGIAQDRTSLGGKLLRLDMKTGKPLPDNPFIDAPNRNERYVYGYGHRNVQGVAVRPGTGAIYTAEHGPDVDDEVNVVKPGANYGWDPSQGGTVDDYDESVPMTDLKRFPDAVPAVWSSGDPTVATSGLSFLRGARWGAFQGALAVSALKGEKELFLRLDKDGALRDVSAPSELDGKYGRLRASVAGPDGALYVTTSNDGDDKLLRITPK